MRGRSSRVAALAICFATGLLSFLGDAFGDNGRKETPSLKTDRLAGERERRAAQELEKLGAKVILGKGNKRGHVVEVEYWAKVLYKGDAKRFDLLARLPYLEKLWVGGDKFDDADFEQIGKLASLQSLTMSLLPGCKGRIRHLERLTNLRELIISAAADEDMPSLARFTKLESLTVNSLLAADQGLKNLQRLRELRKLSLFSSDLTIEHIRQLVKCQNVEILDLGHTGLADDALRRLAAMGKLRSLDLRLNPMLSEKAIISFKRARPDIRVTR